MTKFWLTIGVVSFLLVGCADSGSNAETEETQNVTEAVEENGKDDSVELTISGPEGTTQTDVKVAPSSAGLNPPHGQPGHDCAIAVGAPLDGSGAPVQAAPIASSPTIQPNLNTTAAPAGTNLNPAHGQPGHDCAVAVGAPLPSK